MSELGRLLSEARTAKELSLSDVEAVTRIRQKYLEALENGDFAALPAGATARGFLRIYANFLGVDPSEALRLYALERGESDPDAAPGNSIQRPIDYRPLEVELSDPAAAGRWRWFGALVLVAALAAGSFWARERNFDWNFLRAFGPQPTATASATPTRWVVTATLPPAPSTGDAAGVAPTPTSDLLPLPIPTTAPTATRPPRPTITPTPQPVGQVVLGVHTTQRTWLRVTVDGEVVEESLLEADEDRLWEASEAISLRTGNAAGVSLTLNGEELGAMGNYSQVVERTWVVDEGEVNEASSEADAGTDTAPAAQITPTATATP